MVAIQTPLQTILVPDAEAFSYAVADQICRLISPSHSPKRIIIDLGRAREATTSAFARLVQLRRSLLRSGRDLRLMNLNAKAAGLYEVNRLTDVLPRLEAR
jgi:MFS superfamily sulfate permease-like transporter